ncbi:uncharacterized protein LOC128893914 [Hylaeus anthracinus]|uniref:uncharacterized protein LOC128893914 n=1 Tax=Hylaeus anthracinus TaxID=313031 RepID=UPI0023BA1B6A|nr:uncharacterized protein LOC128893914 [Hylaeus anthracinus]XP_054011223.1 uncharacterized protein LOC128893914 [Hylaeus anthracinus]
MTSFRSKFQIPGFITSKACSSISNLKENGYSILLGGPSLAHSVVKENVRYFWFFKPKKTVEYGSGNCGGPLPESNPVEPCEGCPSKCLAKKTKKKTTDSRKDSSKSEEKLDNCVEEKPVKVKLTWWEQIFGPDPKRFWPDPCTCRVALRQRKKERARDPRLTDPRYKETAGDVFMYTENLKPRSRPCLEPQPKPPPAFKVPKAVLFRMMDEGGEMGPLSNVVIEQKTDENHKISSHEYRIPYEEMRPPERRTRVFTCHEGIRSEDVIRPVSVELDTFRAPLINHQLHMQQGVQNNCNKPEKIEKAPVVGNNIPEQGSQRRSRIEQLKLLIQQKETLQCIALNDFGESKATC